jgi:hypothetical protein
MADLNDLNSAQTVKIVGSDSTGIETTPVESSINGELLIGEKNLHTNISGAQTVTVKTGSGYLRRIVINRTANGSVTVYDNTTAVGTPIIIIGLSNGTSPGTLEYGFNFTTGLTVVTTGNNTDVSILYL